jgi:hypothetical protein
MYFTDLDKTYQLLLGKEKCLVKDEDFTACTTRIETPFALWLQISEGKINGAEAMMKKQYRVSGDFNTMLKTDDYFGTKTPPVKSNGEPDKTNMNILLFPWIVLWVLLPISVPWGGAATFSTRCLSNPDSGLGRALSGGCRGFLLLDEEPRGRLYRADQFRGPRPHGAVHRVVFQMVSCKSRQRITTASQFRLAGVLSACLVPGCRFHRL